MGTGLGQKAVQITGDFGPDHKDEEFNLAATDAPTPQPKAPAEWVSSSLPSS